MIDTTEITCIVTDTRGMNSGNLEMYSLWVDKLFGKHGETVADYICNIHAAGTVELAEPMGVSLRKILDIASEEALSSLEGSGVTFYDGYDESVFRTDARVCLVPNEMKVNDDGIVKVRREGMETVELTVIGTVSGAGKNIVWCPFYTPVMGIGIWRFRSIAARSAYATTACSMRRKRRYTNILWSPRSARSKPIPITA